MNIKRAIFKVFSANMLQIISSLIVGFVVPNILSIEGYANLKTYTLFVTYIGFFHFGFIDGLFIKYGGKQLKTINKSELKGEHIVLILIETLISTILLIISLYIKSIVLSLFAITILPCMIQTFHKLLFQATGEFSNYSVLMYIYTIAYLLFNVILAIVIKSDNYVFYCLITCLAYLCSCAFFEIIFFKENYQIKAIIDKKSIIMTTKVGFFVLLGNLSVVALFGIDKWFIKLFLTTEDFAYYSFAVSLMNIMNTLVSAISVTFYNYLFSNNNYKMINKLKEYLMVIGTFASTAFFVFAFIINTYMKKYIFSIDIISITFYAFPFILIVNALFVNLYKVNKNEKHYLKVVMTMLGISIIYNIIALKTVNNTTGIAVATTATIITWFFYSSKDIKNVYIDKKMIIYLIFSSIGYITCSNLIKEYLLGGIAFFTYNLFLSLCFYRNIYNDFYQLFKEFLKKKIDNNK